MSLSGETRVTVEGADEIPEIFVQKRERKTRKRVRREKEKKKGLRPKR